MKKVVYKLVLLMLIFISLGTSLVKAEDVLQEDAQKTEAMQNAENIKAKVIEAGEKYERDNATGGKEFVQNVKVKNAIQKLIINLGQCFDNNAKPTLIQLQSRGPKTVLGYVNNMRDKQGKQVRYQLLYGRSLPKGTYEKKILAINTAKEKAPQLVKILEYYMDESCE